MQRSISIRKPRRISIQTKLFLSFGLLCVLLSGLLLHSLFHLNRLQNETNHLILVTGEQSRIASEITVATLLCRRYEKDMFLNLHDSTVRSSYYEKWQQSYKQLQQAIEAYTRLATTDMQHQQLDLWKYESSTYQQAVIEVEQAIKDGEFTTPEAANIALTPYKDSIRSLTDSSYEQAERDKQALLQANSRLIETSNQSRQLMVAIGLATLLLAFVWSLYFPRQMLKPIHALQDATRQLTHGNLDIRANMVRQDEFGDLAESFNQMAAQMKQQMVALDQSVLVQQQNEQLTSLLALVQALELPAIPVLDNVLLVPIVGHLDTNRMHVLEKRVVDIVYRQRAHMVIFDYTGVGIPDMNTMRALEQLMQAIHLLGANVIVSGISAAVAQTMSEQNIHLEHAQVVQSVQEAIMLWTQLGR